MSTATYQKIPSPYMREAAKPFRLIHGEWVSPEMEALSGLPWVFTEKVDGTNIRVGWDGYTVTFDGRTSRANMPPVIIDALTEQFPEELFEQAFGEKQVTLYGEMIGGNIMSAGRHYGPMRFVLFDVMIDGLFLLRENVESVALSMGCVVTPVALVGTLHEGMEFVRNGFMSAFARSDYPAEGIVGTTALGLCNRRGDRMIVKIKARDFREAR